MLNIGNRLRELRESKDLKQVYVANYLHTSQQNYSKYENGQLDIPLDYLPLLPDLYQVSVDYILGVSISQNDFNSLGSKKYIDRSLIELIRQIDYLDDENLLSLLNYLDFLIYKQKN